jgi:hypothetical protein
VIAECLLHAATISMNQILIGAPIGFPSCRLSTEPNVCQNLHLNWAPAQRAPGAQFGGLTTLQVIEKNWSALEDDFRTFLLMPGGCESIFQQFTA